MRARCLGLCASSGVGKVPVVQGTGISKICVLISRLLVNTSWATIRGFEAVPKRGLSWNQFLLFLLISVFL